jgi:hypothetical protein
MMKRRWWIVGALVLLELLVGVAIVCSLWAWKPGQATSSRSGRHSRSDFADKTETTVHTLDVLPAMTTVELRMRVRVRDGAFSWKLVDPAGDVQWEDGVVGSGHKSGSRRFEAVEGVWTLELQLESASGSYDVAWTGSN